MALDKQGNILLLKQKACQVPGWHEKDTWEKLALKTSCLNRLWSGLIY
jgi:hypothetical protein